MEIWHYADANNRQYQIDESQLPVAVQQGVIGPATRIWKSGMENWMPAGQVIPQMFPEPPAETPPPAPQAPAVVAEPLVVAELAEPAEPAVSVVAAPSGGQCHEVDFEIFGDDMQLVEVGLDPGETVIAEAGAMNYLEEDIHFEARMGDGSQPKEGVLGKLMAVGKRALTGESIFITHFSHQGTGGVRRVAFAAPYPGKIIPLNLGDIGGELICQKDSFLCAAFGTQISIAFNKKLGAGFFGGEGFILQRLRGDGMAFVHAGGTVIERELNGETLRVDTGCLVAFSPGIEYDIQRAGNLKSMFFGGEGLFLATLRGRGKVWLQSLPFSRLADRIIAHAPSKGGSAQGEGSVLGGLGRILDGD